MYFRTPPCPQVVVGKDGISRLGTVTFENLLDQVGGALVEQEAANGRCSVQHCTQAARIARRCFTAGVGLPCSRLPSSACCLFR